jgi:hypothetical protein
MGQVKKEQGRLRRNRAGHKHCGKIRKHGKIARCKINVYKFKNFQLQDMVEERIPDDKISKINLSPHG